MMQGQWTTLPVPGGPCISVSTWLAAATMALAWLSLQLQLRKWSNVSVGGMAKLCPDSKIFMLRLAIQPATE